MGLKAEFSKGATPGAGELRGYYEVRLVTGFLPGIRFFGHRKFFPDDVGVEDGGRGGFNEFLGRIRIGSFKTGVRDSVLGDGQRILHINYKPERERLSPAAPQRRAEEDRGGALPGTGRVQVREARIQFILFFRRAPGAGADAVSGGLHGNDRDGLRASGSSGERGGAIFRAVMNAIIPRGGAFGPGAADYDLLPRADRILRSYDPAVRKLFPYILLYVQYSAILRKGRTFTALGERKGMEFLASMERSPSFIGA